MSANRAPHISLVVPLFNEEESLEPLYEKMRDTCDMLGRPCEMIFVDDGSTDATYELLERLHERDGRVKAVRFRKNYGQTAAMAAGFEIAAGQVIVSMDGDLQNDPKDIPAMLAKMEEGYDVVCGWRKDRQDKFLTRRVPSMVANWIIGRVTGVPIHDNGCSLKAYRASTIKNVMLYGEMHRFIPAMSTLAGAKIAEIVVDHHARQFGQSKYGLGRVWRVFLDIITIKMITGFAARPALWFGLLSFPVFLAGVPLLVLGSTLFLARSTEQGLLISTVAFLFLFLGAQLISAGIIGELALKTGDYDPRQALRPTVRLLESTEVDGDTGKPTPRR